MSNNCTPALKNEYAVKLGSGLPSAFMCGGLWEPQRPRFSQIVRYGASVGGTGTGSCAIDFGLVGSLTSTTQSGGYGSLQSGLSASGFVITKPRLRRAMSMV